jgi:hypothetical protein
MERQNMNASRSPTDEHEPPSDVRRFRTTSYDPIPVTIEPWGISLFPIPDYVYAVDAPNGEMNFSSVLSEEGPRATWSYDSKLLTEPITIWLGGLDRHTIHRRGGPVPGLVWESTRPSEIGSLLTDRRLAQVLQEAADREDRGQMVFEHQFPDLVSSLVRETGHRDLVLLLREHGIVQKRGGIISLTEWGRQVARMYSSDSEESESSTI